MRWLGENRECVEGWGFGGLRNLWVEGLRGLSCFGGLGLRFWGERLEVTLHDFLG